MKKIVLFLLILLSVTTVFATNGESLTNEGWVPLYGLSIDNLPKVTTKAARDAHMTVEVTVPGFDFSHIRHQYQPFHRITFPEQSNNFNLGAPNIPVLREIISIPEGSTLRLTITDVKYKTYRNVNLEPKQRNLDETEGEADRVFQRDETIYSTNEFYPANWVDSYEMGKHREVNLTTLEMHPVRYNPVTKELQAAYSITFTVEFAGYSRYNVSDIPEHLEETYKGMLLNYDYMNYQLRSEKESSYRAQVATDYLIVSASNLVNSPSLKRLVQYHEDQGRKVEVRDVATMGTTPVEIRASIQKVYDQATPAELDFLLFVGDVDTIPLKPDVYQDTRKSYRSDIWYAFLEGNDMLADVAMGRFPARDEAELANMVKKTLDFHTNAYPGPWQERAILVAHQENYPYKYTACSQSIYDHKYKMPTPTLIRIHGGDKSKNWTNEDVNREIDNGVLVVNYRGHGQDTQWEPWTVASWKTYTADDFRKVKNGTKTPVVFNIACHNGDIGHNGESLSETMIRQQDGGAVAVLGALNTSSTSPNHDFDRALFTGTWDLGIKSIGDLLNYSIIEMMKIHGMDRNVVIYLWVGDPALSIRRTDSVKTKMRLTTDVVGKGSVSLNPAGGLYDEDTVVTATAKADRYWKFTGWSGDASGTVPTTSITMSTYKSITANFTRVELPAPANLTAQTLSHAKISLNWTAVEGAESYTVYSSAAATGTYSEVATVKEASAIVDNLKPVTTYYFKVKATGGNLISPFSAYQSAKTDIIKPSAPEVTITSPANNAEFLTTTTTTIKVVAKVTDINGDLKSVALGTEKAVVAGDIYTFAIANVGPGVYTYEVVATDAAGHIGSAKVTVTVKDGCKLPAWDPAKTYKGGEEVCHNRVHYRADWWHKGSEPGKSEWGPWVKIGSCGGGTTPVNNAPQVNITSPANNASFKAPANVKLTLTAKDSDGKVASVELFEGLKSLGTATAGTNDSYTFELKNLAFGSYTYKVVATDDKGAKGEDKVTIEVTTDVVTPVKDWAPNVAYKSGDIVTYNGVSYKCNTAHTSLRGWEPPNVPSLWSKLK